MAGLLYGVSSTVGCHKIYSIFGRLYTIKQKTMNIKNGKMNQTRPAKPDELIEKFAEELSTTINFLEQRKVFLWGPVTDESSRRAW